MNAMKRFVSPSEAAEHSHIGHERHEERYDQFEGRVARRRLWRVLGTRPSQNVSQSQTVPVPARTEVRADRVDKDDPLTQALLEASDDDEPTTPEEDAEADEAWQDYLKGKARPWSEVRAELAGD